MAAIKEPGQLDDDGKVDGYPVEGLCLAVLDDGRARPAWLCRKGDNRQSSRLRVLIYGDPAGKARLLTSSERVDALPSTDEALAARLQGDWKNASAQERDELLRGCDEMEARRAAPPQFLDMVTRLRAGAKGDAKSLAPSSSAGREFYPNLFPPRVGDAVRVLWDQNQWYEAAAVEEPALDGAVQPASAYSSPPASACWAAFGWAPPPRGAAPPRLHVRYAIDGTRDALVWCAYGVFFSRRVDGVGASTVLRRRRRGEHAPSAHRVDAVGRARDYPAQARPRPRGFSPGAASHSRCKSVGGAS